MQQRSNYFQDIDKNDTNGLIERARSLGLGDDALQRVGLMNSPTATPSTTSPASQLASKAGGYFDDVDAADTEGLIARARKLGLGDDALKRVRLLSSNTAGKAQDSGPSFANPRLNADYRPGEQTLNYVRSPTQTIYPESGVTAQNDELFSSAANAIQGGADPQEVAKHARQMGMSDKDLQDLLNQEKGASPVAEAKSQWDPFAHLKPSQNQTGSATTSTPASISRDLPIQDNPPQVFSNSRLQATYEEGRKQALLKAARGIERQRLEMAKNWNQQSAGSEKEQEYDILGGLKVAGGELARVPQNVAASAIQAIQGQSGQSVVDPDWFERWADEVSRENQLRQQRIAQEYGGKKFLPGVDVKDVAGLGQSLGYSGVSMATGLGAGIGAAALSAETGPAAPAIGWTAGGAVSGATAYRMATADFMKRVLQAKNQESLEINGRPMTADEESVFKKEFDSKATEYGLWEAIPEAIGNVAGLKIITSPLTKVLGKSLATRILGKAVGMYGAEMGTETVTQMGQSQAEQGTPVQSQKKAYSFKSPEDYWSAFKEIAPQTFLSTTLVGGAVGAGVKAHQNAKQNKAIKLYADAAQEELQNLSNEDLTAIAQYGDALAEKRVNKRDDFTAAHQAIKDEVARRATPEPQQAPPSFDQNLDRLYVNDPAYDLPQNMQVVTEPAEADRDLVQLAQSLPVVERKMVEATVSQAKSPEDVLQQYDQNSDEYAYAHALMQRRASVATGEQTEPQFPNQQPVQPQRQQQGPGIDIRNESELDAQDLDNINLADLDAVDELLQRRSNIQARMSQAEQKGDSEALTFYGSKLQELDAELLQVERFAEQAERPEQEQKQEPPPQQQAPQSVDMRPQDVGSETVQERSKPAPEQQGPLSRQETVDLAWRTEELGDQLPKEVKQGIDDNATTLTDEEIDRAYPDPVANEYARNRRRLSPPAEAQRPISPDEVEALGAKLHRSMRQQVERKAPGMTEAEVKKAYGNSFAGKYARAIRQQQAWNEYLNAVPQQLALPEGTQDFELSDPIRGKAATLAGKNALPAGYGREQAALPPGTQDFELSSPAQAEARNLARQQALPQGNQTLALTERPEFELVGKSFESDPPEVASLGDWMRPKQRERIREQALKLTPEQAYKKWGNSKTGKYVKALHQWRDGLLQGQSAAIKQDKQPVIDNGKSTITDQDLDAFYGQSHGQNAGQNPAANTLDTTAQQPNSMESGQSETMERVPQTRQKFFFDDITPQAKQRKTSTIQQVEQIISTYQSKAKNALPSIVVQRQEDLPAHILDELERLGGGETPAVYDPSTKAVYFVADNVKSDAQAVAAHLSTEQRLWRHEQVGHHGLREYFKEKHGPLWEKRFGYFLDEVHRSAKDKEAFSKLQQTYAKPEDMSMEHYRQLLAEEYFASEIVEKRLAGETLKGKAKQLWNRFMIFVRSLVRHAYPDLKISHAEMEQVALKAFNWTMGKGSETGVSGAVFGDMASRASKTQSNTSTIENAVSDLNNLRSARGTKQAREAAKEFRNRPLKNYPSGITATVSGESLGKMLSYSAVTRSVSPQAHMQAVANLDKLFAHALPTLSRPDKKATGSIKSMHHFEVPMPFDDDILNVKILAKEFVDQKEGTRIYLVRTVEIEKPASNREALTSAEPSQVPFPPAGFSKEFSTLYEAVKKGQAEKKNNPLFRKSDTSPVDPNSRFDHVNERLKAASKSPGKAPLGKQAAEFMSDAYKSFTRHFIHLDSKTDGAVINTLREFQEAPHAAWEKAGYTTVKHIKELSPDERDVFTRTLVLSDMMRDIESGLLDGDSELPFAYENAEQAKVDYAHYQHEANRTPAIKKALEERREFMGNLRKQLVEHRLLPKEILDSDPNAYFHHAVLEYMNLTKGPGVGSKDLRTKKKGWQKERTGSTKDYSTNYLEAEVAVIAQGLVQVTTQEALNKIQSQADIKADCEKQAREANLKAMSERLANEDVLAPFNKTSRTELKKLAKMAKNGELPIYPEFEHIVESLAKDENKIFLQAGEYQAETDPKLLQFLSSLVNGQGVGAKQAAAILKSIKGRNTLVKQTLGKQYKTFRDFMPEGYVEWKPQPGGAFHFTNSLADKAIEDLLSGNKQLQETEVHQVLARGRDAVWVVPDRVAKTLDELKPARNSNFIGDLSEAALAKWKQWILINPMRIVRYNMNNMSGDLDIALAYDPKMLKHTPKAFKDLWSAYGKGRWKIDDALRFELNEAMERGVIDSGMTQMDIPDLGMVNRMDEFIQVLDGRNLKSAKGWAKLYWEHAKGFTTLRENILRLAAYRHFKEQLAAGETNIYAASKKSEIDAITDPNEKAAKLARELVGDYGNVSHSGQWIRKHLIPFWSWAEVNAPRYVRMIRNLPHEGKGGKDLGRAMAVNAGRMTWKASKLGLKYYAMAGLIQLWNRTFFADEDDELQEAERNQLHLILGRREDGTIRSIRIQGALSDALAWVGLENPLETFRGFMEGDTKETLTDMAKSPVNKIWQGVRPEMKLAITTTAGVSTYPDVFNPRPVRDRMQSFLKTFSLDKPYKALAGKPMRGGSVGEQFLNDLSSMFVYDTDPGQNAYWNARKQVWDWKRAMGYEDSSTTPTNRSNALYYYKQAIRYGDFDAARKYYMQYLEHGGKRKGIAESVKRAHPLAGIPKKYQKWYVIQLSEKERKTLRSALAWYQDVYLRRSRVKRNTEQ